MKNLLLIFLASVLVFTACKKKEVQPAKIPYKMPGIDNCKTDNHSLSGNYTTNEGVIISIEYFSTQCDDYNIINYKVKGLLEAFNARGVSIENQDYFLIANEKNQAHERGSVQFHSAGTKAWMIKVPEQSDYAIGMTRSL